MAGLVARRSRVCGTVRWPCVDMTARASARAALFARCPVSRITATTVDASTVLSGAVMAKSISRALLLSCSWQSREAAHVAAAGRKCNDSGAGTMGRRMKLKDQVAVVTGAGRNIGEEGAKLFAAEGAQIAGVDLGQPRGGGGRQAS